MAFIDNFDANTVEPKGSFKPLPEGEYLCVIRESSRDRNKKGTGDMLTLKFEVAQGPHRGRTLYSRLNCWHQNQQASDIARSELSAICRAVGVMTPKDSQELHNIPLILEVDVDAPTADGKVYNRIAGYAKRDAAATVAAPASAQGEKPRWMRNQDPEIVVEAASGAGDATPF